MENEYENNPEARTGEGQGEAVEAGEGREEGRKTIEMSQEDIARIVDQAEGQAEGVASFNEEINDAAQGELTSEEIKQMARLIERAGESLKKLKAVAKEPATPNREAVTIRPIISVEEKVLVREPVIIDDKAVEEAKKKDYEKNKEVAEKRIEEIKMELYEKAGERSFEGLTELIENTNDIFVEQREKGWGCLGENIQDIESGPFGKEFFVDEYVAYLPREGEAIMVGDTHGDFEATMSSIEQSGFIENMETGDKKMRIVMTGDYADRGKKDLANLELVLSLKMKYPDNVILLRGNHEETYISKVYGLYDSIEKKYGAGSKTDEIFDKYTDLFENMPGILVAANGLVATHGGIPSRDISSLGNINDKGIIEGMRWNDPDEKIGNRGQPGNRGMKGSKKFGKRAFNDFMQSIGGGVMLRSHEVVVGATKLFGDKFVTIFSNGSAKSPSSAYHSDVHNPQIARVNLEENIEQWKDSNFETVSYVEPSYRKKRANQAA